MDCINVIKSLQPLLPRSIHQAIRLLVPIWVDSRVVENKTHSYQTIYSEAQAIASNLGMPHLMHLHSWLPQTNMATYYSLGVATLCIGNFIESFGNVSIESQLAGTPALVSRVGAQRTVLPDDLTWKCDFGDTFGVAESLARIINDKTRVSSAFSPYILSHYSEKDMREKYVNAIEQVKITASSTFLIGKMAGVEFSGGGYDTRKSVSADIGAGRSLACEVHGLR